MKTKAAEPAEAPQAPLREISRGDVPTKDIAVVANFRRHFDEKRMAELADSVRKNGVLVPVLLRRTVDVGVGAQLYTLIAGERRLRAAIAAGLEEIPARVLDVDEKQAAEIQALENLHRADLGPIEEARAFKTLLDQGSYDVKGLADRIDKSEAYVYRALKLLELPEKALKAIEEGLLTPAHGYQLARVPEKNMETLVKFATSKYGYSNRLPTLLELKTEIEKTVEKDLNHALFPKDREYAGAQACTGCPYNTGNQGNLFDGAEKGSCTNPGCYNKKTAQYYRDFEEKASRHHGSLRHVGAATATYGLDGVSEVKGFPVLSEDLLKSKDVKKAMESAPEAFGVATIKPSKYYQSQGKKPKLVVVCTDPSVLPAKARPQERREAPERDWELEREIRTETQRRVYAAAWGKLKGERFKTLGEAKPYLVALAESSLGYHGMDELRAAAGLKKASAQELAKRTPDELLLLLWIAEFDTDTSLPDLCKAVKADHAVIAKEVRKELTDAKKAKAAK